MMTAVPGLADVLRDALPSSASPAAKRAAEALRETYRSGAPPSALALGADLPRRSADPDLARIHWEQVRFDLATTLPGSDLITACYLLGEPAPEAAARGHSAPRRTRPWAAAALTHRPRRRSPCGTLARARRTISGEQSTPLTE